MESKNIFYAIKKYIISAVKQEIRITNYSVLSKKKNKSVTILFDTIVSKFGMGIYSCVHYEFEQSF